MGRNVRDKKRPGALVPEDQLRLSVAVEVADDLVVVLVRAALLDHVPFPGDVRIEARIRIFPPPNLGALPVAAENDVEVAIAIDVIGRAARFDSEQLRLDHVALPACRTTPVPNQRRGLLTEADDEVLNAILIEIGDEIARLLRGLARNRQLTLGAGQAMPFDLRGKRRRKGCK